jgi:hypothetical protein
MHALYSWLISYTDLYANFVQRPNNKALIPIFPDVIFGMLEPL